ncbi:hypothetical protein BG20_I0293 [Candidatus Nitrosarchaeum limnium BG20]|uniref:Uncharacterized protein n=1 Tax=Candidatus Nitrosarchaeum limnium BG20 TaxID=859192 RepID=S2E8C8_9ARCH|nr:hypothetical protein BG20_I0293 [Candidatus Nitrosarchaeum limnium BG20]
MKWVILTKINDIDEKSKNFSFLKFLQKKSIFPKNNFC